MAQTKKVYTTGRFGSRYGVGIRKRVLKVEMKQKARHECPFCGFPKIKRISKGIYVCKKCDSKFAGGTYTPSTLAGNIIKRMVQQKKFIPITKELIESGDVSLLELEAGQEISGGLSEEEQADEGKGKKERKEKSKKGKKGE